jgi:hypothetical protein
MVVERGVDRWRVERSEDRWRKQDIILTIILQIVYKYKWFVFLKIIR